MGGYANSLLPITPQGRGEQGTRGAEQSRGEDGFVKKRVCEVGPEDWAVCDVEVGEQSHRAGKHGTEVEKHEVQLP